MDTSIFGEPLKDVTYADVVSFCSQEISEGLNLDYKRDLSSLPKVVKALVSFANTNGGWLVIGVEDKNDKPKLPVTGMDFEGNFIQKINNSIISNVSPIVLPFYQVCPSDDGTKAFLIAYMPQSASTPHWMSYGGNNILFTRVADRAKRDEWEKYASSSEWEMLRDRRQASVKLRGELADLLHDIFEARVDYQDEVEETETVLPAGTRYAVPTLSPSLSTRHIDGTQTITLLPEYPRDPVTDTLTVQRALLYEPISNGLNDYRYQTPDTRGGDDAPIYQYGASTYYRDEHSHHNYFFGADIYGNIMNVEPVETRRSPEDSEPYTLVEISSIVTCIDGVLRFAQRHYSKIGVVGNILLRVQFFGGKNCLLYRTNAPNFPMDAHHPPRNITGHYLVRKKIDTNILDDLEARNRITFEITKEIFHSFNYAYFKGEDLVALIGHASKSVT